MKAINKSNLMKRAWNIFKGGDALNFSSALKMAWEIEKGIVKKAIQKIINKRNDIQCAIEYMFYLMSNEYKQQQAYRNSEQYQIDLANSMSDYYKTGAYCGD